MPAGGWGMTPWGRSQWGNAASDIEPRFYTSTPIDHQTNVRRNQVTRFTTYCYSSFVDESCDLFVEVSENGGISYAPVFLNGAFVDPYNGSESKIRRVDGQQLRVYVQNSNPWNANSQVVFRVTMTDEFGQEATKTVPVVW